LWPLLQPNNKDGDLAACQILLVAHVSVRGEEQIEAGLFCGVE